MVEGELEELPGLVVVPGAVGAVDAVARRERTDDFPVDGLGEVTHTSPLIAGQDTDEPLRGLSARGAICVEVGRVRPRAAHADVGRAERLRQVAQPFRGQVDGGANDFSWPGVVRLPELAACHLDHLDVVGLVAGVNNRNDGAVVDGEYPIDICGGRRRGPVPTVGAVRTITARAADYEARRCDEHQRPRSHSSERASRASHKVPTVAIASISTRGSQHRRNVVICCSTSK